MPSVEPTPYIGFIIKKADPVSLVYSMNIYILYFLNLLYSIFLICSIACLPQWICLSQYAGQV